MSSFAWPPMYAFPPFFTLQPVDATRAKQVEQWKQVVMAWHAAHKKSELAVKEWPGWENPAIKRRLSDEGIQAVANHIVATGGGEWLDAAHTRMKIFTRTPVEWASLIWTWAGSRGFTGSRELYTVYDLHSGEAAGLDAPTAGVDSLVLYRALCVLEREGKVVLARPDGLAAAEGGGSGGTSPAAASASTTALDEVGVKFL